MSIDNGVASTSVVCQLSLKLCNYVGFANPVSIFILNIVFLVKTTTKQPHAIHYNRDVFVHIANWLMGQVMKLNMIMNTTKQHVCKNVL